MQKTIVLSDGDKLKAIRKKYDLRQDEISGQDITRNLISEIETNKANITKKTAEVIIKNLIEVGKKKHFKVTETVEYLIENETIQATKILDKYLSELKAFIVYKDNSFVDTLKEVEDFLVKWDITDKKVSIYELAGDYYCNQNELNRSIVYYEKALTLIGKLFLSSELLKLLLKLSKTYGNAGRYAESIDCCNFVLEHFENLSKQDIMYFVYNRAYVFYLSKNYKRALVDIEKIKDILEQDDLNAYFTVLDTKAVCLKEIGKYEEAIETYRHLLEILDKESNIIDKKLVVHINMAKTYMASSETNKVNSIFKIVQQELPFINSDSQYEADIYFEVGKIYEYLNNLEEANKYYNKALDTAKKKKNYVLVTDILDTLMNSTDIVKNLDSIKNEVFAISFKQDKLQDKLIHKLIGFYIAKSDLTKIDEINNFAMQFI